MKNIAFCFVLFLGLFVFFACGSAPPPPDPAPAPAPVPEPEPKAPTRILIPPPPSREPPRPQEPPKARVSPSRSTDLILTGAETYIVVKGDTLSKISKRKYKNSYYYPLIMMASRGIVKNQDHIQPGMVLTIPKLQPNLNDARARASMKKYFLEVADITSRKRPSDAAGLRRLARSL
jgi:hypothetical protein